MVLKPPLEIKTFLTNLGKKGTDSMRFKKILIAIVVIIVVLIAGIYAFLAYYDFNQLKPMITRAVKDATGRELNIAGNIDVGLSIPPTLTAEDIGFQNAPWSSTPNLARVKRMEAQVAILPLILGDLDFIRLVLVEPEVIVEFNDAGTSNFAFDTVSETVYLPGAVYVCVGFSSVLVLPSPKSHAQDVGE